MSQSARPRRALLSVSDKTGIVELAKRLVALDVQILSTGGTARALREAGLPVTDVAEITGFPEILDGRVKTLHPRIHGALLGLRSDKEHMRTMEEHSIVPIDLVAVNLYPFEEVTSREGTTFEEAIENIDIGGPSMLRSAAKNHQSVVVLCDPSDYGPVLAEIEEGGASATTRAWLARKVYEHTSRYDAMISGYLTEHEEEGGGGPAPTLPARPAVGFTKVMDLRYGENPHQKAAFYRDPQAGPGTLARAEKVHGKDLSYNNLLDLDGALAVVASFTEPAACVVKHTNPCGAAVAATLPEAFTLALEGDPLSAFGGIVGLNRPVDRATAEAMTRKNQFFEAVVAPRFEPDALEILAGRSGWGEQLRCIALGAPTRPEDPSTPRYVSVSGGLLSQSSWGDVPDRSAATVPTARKPTGDDLRALWFAFAVCRHVKSNAILLARGAQVVGVGAGQMSRVDAVEAACRKAGERARGSVLASDAFFPFPDGVERAAEAGVVAVIQPGGSKKDDAVVAACDRLGLTMVMTGYRVFRH
jgi:phosphoribosylaminoimidazolecarboxamide formyltransferase/IMP cyclohydrolase